MPRIAEEHRALVEAALNREADKASDILREHIERAAKLATDYLSLPQPPA